MIEHISKMRRALFGCFLLLSLIASLPLTAAWTQPPTLVSEPGVSVQFENGPCLDVNASNNGVATWVANDPANAYASSYTFGIGWSPFQILNSLALDSEGDRVFQNIANTQVSLNENNFAAAVWQGTETLDDEVGSTFPAIFSATRSPNGVWAPQQRVSAVNLSDGFDAEQPSGALNDAGKFVAVWWELRLDDGTNDFIYVMTNTQQVGGGWGTPEQIAGPFFNFPSDFLVPNVQINSRGDVIAVYKRFTDTGVAAIEASTFSAATNSWSPPFSLDTTGVNVDDFDQNLPRAAIDDNGNAVAVWTWLSGNVSRTYAASFTPGLGWGPSIILHEVTDAQTFEASVVIDRFGRATAVWDVENENDNTDLLYSSSLPLGGTWSLPVIISPFPVSFTDGHTVQRSVSVDLNGNVIVIFENNDDINGTNNLYSVANFVGFGWQVPELITSSATFEDSFDTFNLNIGYGSCGFAISLWQGSFGESDSLVYASTNFVQPPPCLFTGTQCREKFAMQSFCANRLTWGSCNFGCILFYHLYRNGVLIATIPANGPHTFNDPVDCKGPSVVYTLTAVNIFGVESPPAVLVLP